MMSDKREFLNAVISADNIVLTTHVKPDGDALGSMFGFASVLEQTGKKVFCYLEGAVSPHYSFLPFCNRVSSDLTELHNFIVRSDRDVAAIILDCGDMKRIGDNFEEILDIHPSLVIDHHLGNKGFGDLNWIEPHRSSTGEMVVDLVGELGYGISEEAAKCFYVAIVSDTGSFRYESTTAHTMKVAAGLIEKGVRPHEVMRELYDNFPLGRIRLLQLVLGTLQVFLDNRVAMIRVDQEMLARTGTTIDDTEEFVSHIRAIKGVRVAVFIKDVQQDRVSVSLRGNGSCDLSRAAAEFGGGGHRNAAGFRLAKQEADDLLDRLIQVLQVEMARFDQA